MDEASHVGVEEDPDAWSRIVLEAAPNAMVMIDRNGIIELVNRGTERLFGYAREELLGEPLETLVPERFRAGHGRHLQGFFADPQTRAMGAGRELFGRRRDGSEVQVEIGLNPISTARGMYTLASIIDVTERKRAEAAHERLASIVESSDDAIVSRGLDGRIDSWNRAASRLFGYSAEEAIGQPILMLVPARLVDEETRIMRRLDRAEPLEPYDTTIRSKDGAEVHVAVRRSAIRTLRGTVVVGESIIARDLTELERREAELRRSNAELEQFAYVASHDLQEPLRMVANYTQLLGRRYRGQLDERADKYINYAADGARRMQQLVADLLAYSRVGSQGKPMAPVSAEAVLAAVTRSLQPLVLETGARITSADLPLVMADEVQLRQLLQNLVGNAIKFRGAAPPQIRVDAGLEGAEWHFRVADNGIGIEMAHAERIFQMFQRLHALGEYDGSGIGLAISKRIVERHGGRIWVESTPGVGSTFHFTLRAAHEAPR